MFYAEIYNTSGGRGSSILATLIVLGVSSFCGCGPSPQFQDNRLYAKRLEIEIGQPLQSEGLADVRQAIDLIFGSADVPGLPPSTSEHTAVISLDNLNRAAGRVYSDQAERHFGLYRENCIRCHGTSGDGRGPAARLLSPYPRDFRLGKFKFKSTSQGDKPTKQDIQRTLFNGIPGTSMPSFALLPAEDLEALAEYVVYLSARGETERELLAELAHNLDYSRGQRLLGELAPLNLIANRYLHSWNTQSLEVPEPPDNYSIWPTAQTTVGSLAQPLTESIARGEQLFQSNLASCAKCHGPDGSGLNAPRDYDVWTKEWTLAIGIDPEDRNAIRPLLKAGGLKPVLMQPRNLRLGIFRGGNRPEDLYRRITQGIEGTSMPALAVKPQVAEGLSEEQVWDIVNFVLSLRWTETSGALTTASPTQLPGVTL